MTRPPAPGLELHHLHAGLVRLDQDVQGPPPDDIPLPEDDGHLVPSPAGPEPVRQRGLRGHPSRKRRRLLRQGPGVGRAPPVVLPQQPLGQQAQPGFVQGAEDRVALEQAVNEGPDGAGVPTVGGRRGVGLPERRGLGAS